MTADWKTTLPADMAGTLNLMAHPAAMVATGAALALGVASHFYGLWAGAVAGSLEASRQLLDAGTKKPAYRAPASMVTRTRAAVDTIIADAESTAREVTRAASAVVDKPKPRASQRKPGRKVAAATPAVGDAGRKPRSAARPARPDDLKQIAGIGPKLEQVLNGLGVWTFAQIAKWTPEEIDWIEDYLAFKGRVSRDGWIAQAARLAAGSGAGR